jgi:hypothetical protein
LERDGILTMDGLENEPMNSHRLYRENFSLVGFEQVDRGPSSRGEYALGCTLATSTSTLCYGCLHLRASIQHAVLSVLGLLDWRAIRYSLFVMGCGSFGASWFSIPPRIATLVN